MYSEIFKAIVPVLWLVVAGFALRRVGWFTGQADSSLMAVLVRFFYPMLILSFIVENEALEQADNVLWPPLVGFFTVTMGFVLGFLGARALGLERGADRRTFAFAVGIFNYGFLAIPVSNALYDFDRGTNGVLLVHNVGVEVAFWTVGYALITGTFNKRSWRQLFNPPIVAIVLGLGVNYLLAWQEWTVPDWIWPVVNMPAACAIPFGLLLSGATFADLMREPGWWRQGRVIGGGLALRLGILPLLFLVLAMLLPVTTELQRVLIVQAAMPSGILPVVFARHYGGNPRIAMAVVLSTTVVAIVTIPLWAGLGVGWILD